MGIESRKKTGRIVAAASAFFAVAVLVAVFSIALLYPQRYKAEIAEASRAFGVPESLVRAVIKTESGYKRRAVSRAGAVGLMQLMPSTARWAAALLGDPSLADDLTDPKANITLGTAYLGHLLRKYSLPDALAAYNAGEGNLLKWKTEAQAEYPFPETRNYVQKVLSAEKVYRRLRGPTRPKE